jgi:hypothetical protein
MSYGVIFWGSSTDSKKVFNIQKKTFRIIACAKRTVSCRKLLPTVSEFLLSLLSFVVENTEGYQTNSNIHNINTRQA